jgi:hypothetical protein
VKSIVRLLLVCFLLVALPFQAFAQASMRPLAVPAQQVPPCHQQMNLGHEHKTMVQAASGHDHHAAQHAKGKCGTCAACCVGAAMAPSLPASLALAPSSTALIPFHASHLPSVDPVLPERPPSPLLA